MDDEEYRVYLKLLRIQDDASVISGMSLTNRMRFHRILHFGMKMNLRLSKKKVYVLNKVIKPPAERPVIYTLTHVGHDDVAVAN